MSEKIHCSRIRYTPSKCVQLLCNNFEVSYFFCSAIIAGGGDSGEGVEWKVAALPMPCYVVQ
jgi:hypothetical protein